MLKQRPSVYLAPVVAFGGLLLAGVPVDQVLLIGFVAFMVMMHLGGHGHDGQTGNEERATQEDPAAHKHLATAPKQDEAAGK